MGLEFAGRRRKFLGRIEFEWRPMQVKVGDISAGCPQCQTTQFTTAGGDCGRGTKLLCEYCGHETTRAELLMQIEDKAARQAREGLARLRRQRSGTSKLPDS